MSAPYVNPASPTPLPAGWVARFDVDKQAWFYIDTFGQPPVKSWQHPLGVLAPAPLQNNYAQPHKPSGPGIPSQQPGHSRPHNPYSQPYHPPQQPMTRTQRNFQGHPSPHHAGPPQASVPIQPPQQAHYGQTGSPHAPGPYSNYGAGQVHSGHGGNHSTAQNQQQQPEPAKEGGCFSGLCGSDSAKKAQKGLMKTFMKEATKFVKQHLLNQSDNKDQSETEPTSDINDKVMQLNAAYDNSASDSNDTNGYGDQYQNNRY